MKKIVVLLFFFLSVFPMSSNAAGDELSITCRMEGSEMYSFSFRKPLPHEEFCGPVDESNNNHRMASEIIKAPGIYKVVSIEKYGITLVKGKDFSKEEIGEKIKPILAKYLKTKKIIITYQ
jgi:hypothetical protein